MNKKVAAFALAIFAAQTVYAEVEFSGFVDMSVSSDDGDASMSLDQFELDVSTDLGEGISMRADVNAMGPTAPVELEQAFITYDTGEGLALTVGKFLSCTGFEAAEPTGMYQYSYSATMVYGGYQNGVAASYGSDMFGLYGAVVSSVWDGAETDFLGYAGEAVEASIDTIGWAGDIPVTKMNDAQPAPESDFGFEAQATLTPISGLTAKAALAWEDGFEHATQEEPFDRALINIWAAYETGPLTLAAEFNGLGNWEGGDMLYESGAGYLAMANYGISDKVGVTGRISGMTLTDAVVEGAADYEVSEITIAPSYAISDNWGLVAEVKMLTEGDADAVTQIALESLLTF